MGWSRRLKILGPIHSKDRRCALLRNFMLEQNNCSVSPLVFNELVDIEDPPRGVGKP